VILSVLVKYWCINIDSVIMGRREYNFYNCHDFDRKCQDNEDGGLKAIQICSRVKYF